MCATRLPQGEPQPARAHQPQEGQRNRHQESYDMKEGKSHKASHSLQESFSPKVHTTGRRARQASLKPEIPDVDRKRRPRPRSPRQR